MMIEMEKLILDELEKLETEAKQLRHKQGKGSLTQLAYVIGRIDATRKIWESLIDLKKSPATPIAS